MTTLSSPTATSALAAELFPRTRRLSARVVSAFALALVAHSAMATYALGRVRDVSRDTPPLAVEFLDAEPPPPPPPPAPEPETPKAAEPSVAPAAAPPPAARAANLMTAKEDVPSAQTPDEPVDFTTDPNGTSFGGGVVARGGTADFGVKGAVAGPARPAAPRAQATGSTGGSELVPLANLSRKPALGESDPCRGFFPGGAQSDTASAGVFVVLSKAGKVTSARVVTESPAGEGFGAAARACMLSKSFLPALDRSGNPAATSLRVNVRFRR
jgi:protein TonB